MYVQYLNEELSEMIALPDAEIYFNLSLKLFNQNTSLIFIRSSESIWQFIDMI